MPDLKTLENTLDPLDAAAFVYDCDLPHLGAKLEKNDTFELLVGGLDAEVKVADLDLEYTEDGVFFEDAEGRSSSIVAWFCFCLDDRLVSFFLLLTSALR